MRTPSSDTSNHEPKADGFMWDRQEIRFDCQHASRLRKNGRILGDPGCFTVGKQA